jgi:hypothetical protein
MIYAQLLLWIFAAGMLWRLRRENETLSRARRRTAALMRRLKRDRDSRQISFEACAEEMEDEFYRNVTLTVPSCPPIACEPRCTNEECRNQADAECERYVGPDSSAMYWCEQGDP